MMRILLFLGISLLLSASQCKILQKEYKLMSRLYEEKTKEKKVSTAVLYERLNDKIDAGVAYSVWCHDLLDLSEDYELMQSLRRDAKQRERYVPKVIEEYQRLHRRKPQINNVYQNNPYHSAPGGPKILPPLNSHPLPPISR